MKKFGKLKLLSLVFILMGALIFVGFNFLEAKKPQQWEWKVYIPGAGTGIWNLYAYGNPLGNLFTDTDPIFVRVKKDKRPFRTPYSFRLWIEKDRENLEKIGFYDLNLVVNADLEPSGNGPCSFPPNVPCPSPDVPYCMKNFLENYPHPYTDSIDDNYDYEEFWLSIDVDCDIEVMKTGEMISPSGSVFIHIIKTDGVLPTGCEDLHNLVVNRDVDEESGIIKITKVSENSWEIIVDTTEDSDNGTIRFTEAYWGYRGKGKGRFETKKPIRAKAPFKFITTWARSSH